MAEPTPEPEVVAGSNAANVSVTVTPTAYVVLRLTDLKDRGEPNHWEPVGENLTAPSAERAIRIYAERAGDHAAGTYVAVPQRSWKPVTVQAVQTTVLKLEEAR